MIDSGTIQNIALIGFMGTGKSSAGRLVADTLNFEFIDTDEQIEKRAGKSISQIFSEDGEVVFRECERTIITELAGLRKVIISTGGGVGANEKYLRSLKQHALVICLWASPETIWNRVRTQTHRPLLQTGDAQKKIMELLSARDPVYRQADVLVNTEVRSVREVAQQIVHEFRFATRV
ncbi:MAG: shikimate kinase [Verrucomicrobiota bacterium]